MTGQGERLRRLRMAAGFSQSELARRAGVSRQALGAMEAGAYQPGVGVALRLARLLGESVERLFGEAVDDAPMRVEAAWAGATAAPEARVALGRVGGTVVAVPLPATELRLTPPSGMMARATDSGPAATTFHSPAEIDATLLIAGCDPAATLLADWLAQERRRERAVVIAASSNTALDLMVAGHIHAAGVHLADAAGASANLGAASQRLPPRHAAVLVHFAEWELGFATAAGNPLRFRDAADLGRPGIRLVNRDSGAGARIALDRALTALGIDASAVAGYQREARGHLAVAASIAERQADVGLTLRVAADAYGLAFLPLRREQYELVIAANEFTSAPIEALMDALNTRRFAREVEQLCGYDTRRMGEIVARIH
jgi:putative molybdopterin biosynthesis protein